MITIAMQDIDIGHWKFPHNFDPSEWFGFVYRITELDTQTEYIGKKQFNKLRRKTIKGRKNKKHVITESTWKCYTGSSVRLNEQIELKGKDNYKFEIQSLHKTKGSLHYAEVQLQIQEDVLRAKNSSGGKKYYNKQIASIRFIPPDELEEEKAMNIKAFRSK